LAGKLSVEIRFFFRLPVLFTVCLFEYDSVGHCSSLLWLGNLMDSAANILADLFLLYCANLAAGQLLKQSG
jgi:hypothetical protein